VILEVEIMAKRKSSKMASVRQALSDLGSGAKPQALQEHLKTKLGIDMSTSHISNYKTAILKKEGKRRRRRGKRTVAAKVGGGRGGSISLADIQAVKALTDRIGAEKVKELAAVLSK
jgi:hypothetical protein